MPRAEGLRPEAAFAVANADLRELRILDVDPVTRARRPTSDYAFRRGGLFAATGPIPGEAAVLHRVETGLADRQTQVIDYDWDGDPNDEAAVWLRGETYLKTTTKW